MDTDAGGAEFGIREVEYGTPFGGVFLGNDPNGGIPAGSRREGCIKALLCGRE